MANKGLTDGDLEVWQAKDLRADLVDLWQTRDLAAFLKRAENISEPGTDPWRLPLAPFEACLRQAGSG